MNNHELLATIRNRDQQIHRLRAELQSRSSVNYEEKYKKALKSIQDIIKANRQIKEELDSLRAMRQAEHDSLGQAQNEQFKKSYDAVLREKNVLVSQLQSLELENQKLRYTISDLENQLQSYKSQRFNNNFNNNYEQGQNQQNTQQLQQNSQVLAVISNGKNKSSDNKESSQNWKQKQAELHRTLQSYEDHNNNLRGINKRLEEKVGELENKNISIEKQWRNKMDSKELQLIDAKSQIRQEFTEQVSALRKENSNLKIVNNDLSIKLEAAQKNINYNYQPKFDWEADLVQEMIAVKSNLEPLRQQISQLQEINIYQKEQSVRERTNLRTQVLELEAQVERQTDTIKSLEKKIVDSHQETLALEEKSSHLKRLEQQNELLQGRMIVMESREVALRNRSGEELQERVLQFENRVELLLTNKEGLKELKQINIHQLLALKAYIMELDSKIKELLSSNNYLTKKYKSYKEKYQNSLKQQKNFNVTINSLKMKILGYDKLVLKLQEELEYNIRHNQTEMYQIHTVKTTPQDESNELYRKKYEMIKEKLEIQEKYKLQEMQTLKLNYQTKIMELAIQLDQMRSLKETLELYRLKNQELQMALSKKESEVYENRSSNPLKGSGVSEQQSVNIRQTKDIINNLHLTIKQSDETIFKLQSELRSKEDSYKKTISRLERQLSDLRETHDREASKKDIEKNLQYDQQIKKYKSKVSDLEHELHLLQISHRDEYNRKTDNFDFKLKQLQQRVQQAQTQREEEIYIKRRVEKQNLTLTADKEELQATVRDLQSKLQNLKQLQRENYELKYQVTSTPKQDNSYLDYQLQSKDNTIRQLKREIDQLRSNADSYGEKDITINSLRNQIYHLKQQIEDHNEVINRYNSEITMLKSHVDSSKMTFNTGLESMLEQKDASIAKLRKESTTKDFRISELQQENTNLQEELRRARRDLSQIEYLRQQLENNQRVLSEKSSYGDKLRFELSGHEEEMERYKREASYLKDNCQKLSSDLLEKQDEISRLKVQISTSSLRSREQFESRLREQLQQRQRQFNKLNSDYNNLRSTLTMFEDEKQYQEENQRRTSNELVSLRSQISQLQQQNSSLSEQIYYKNQQVSKMSINVQNSQMLQDEIMQKDGQLAKLRAELFALKTSTSALEDEIYQKQASASRMMKELSYVREQFNELQMEHSNKSDAYNRLSQELSSMRREQDGHFSQIQEKDTALSRLTMELNNFKNKYHELEQQMEEREQQFTQYCNEIASLKSTIGFHQDEVDEKQNQIARSMSERDNLRNEIITLNEQLTDKNVEINRLKQEIFSIKMEISQNQYDLQFKQEQDMMNYRTKITMLEHDLQDKQAQIRRLGIELQTSRYKPAAYSPDISEEEIQQLRNEVNRKQRELIAMKFQLDDKIYQAQSANNTVGVLKQTISELQQTQDNDREQFDRMIREASGRERRLNDQVISMREQIQRLTLTAQRQKPKSYAITYSEEEMNEIQERLAAKQSQIIQIRNSQQQKLFYIETLESKVQMQQRLIGQLQQQAREDQTRVEGQIQEYIRKERELRATLSQLQLQERVEERPASQQGQGQEYQVEARMYLEQIDRLNGIIQELQDEVQQFKLKLSSMINQETRIEQNLVTMVLLMTEIQALRQRVKSKQSQINEVRKSFIQMAVAGELESNKMSRLLDMAQERHSQEQFSHEKLEENSFERLGSITPNSFDNYQHQTSELPSVQHFSRDQFGAAPIDNYDVPPYHEKGFKKEETNYYEHQSSGISYQNEPSSTVQYSAYNQENPTFEVERQQLQFNEHESSHELPPGSGSERYMDNYYENPINVNAEERDLDEQEEMDRRMREQYEQTVRREMQTTKQKEGEVRQLREEQNLNQEERAAEDVNNEQNIEENKDLRREDRKYSFINQLQKESFSQQQQAQSQQIQQVQPQQVIYTQQQAQPQQIIQAHQQSVHTLAHSSSSRGQIKITIQNPNHMVMSNSHTSQPNRYFNQPTHHSMVAQSSQSVRISQGQPQQIQRQSYHMVQQGPIHHQVSGSPAHSNVVRVSPGHTVIYQGAPSGYYRPPY